MRKCTTNINIFLCYIHICKIKHSKTLCTRTKESNTGNTKGHNNLWCPRRTFLYEIVASQLRHLSMSSDRYRNLVGSLPEFIFCDI